MTALPVWVHEFVAAPLAALLALLLLEAAFGLRRAAVEFLALVAYGYALEAVAIRVFASHAYGDAWRVAPGGVPLAVAVVWAAVIPAAIAVAARLGFTGRLRGAAAAAVLATSLDLLVEPVALRSGLWQWTPPGAWLGVPIGNFVGWGIIVGSYAWGASAPAFCPASLLRRAARRGLLALVSIGALVAIGLVWRGLGAEQHFEGRGTWVAGLLLGALLGLRFPRRAAQAGQAFPALLAAAPRGYSLAVFALLLATFSADAVGLREAPLVSLALAVSVTLLFTLDAAQ
jgi:uncharacterized membrane protein